MKTLDLVMIAAPSVPLFLGLFGIGGSGGGISLGDVKNVVGGQFLGGGVGGIMGLGKSLGLDSLFGGSGFKMPEMTKEQKEAQAALMGQGKQLQGVGSDLLGKFQRGELTAGQQAQLALTGGAAKAGAENFLAGSGLSDSSFGVGLRENTQLQLDQMKQGLLEGNFQDSLSALGMSASDFGAVMSGGQFQQNLQAQIALAKQQAASSGMGSLFGAVGMIGGAMFGGPMGAMAGGAIGGAIGGGVGSGANPY